jgi:hypothetical protein
MLRRLLARMGTPILVVRRAIVVSSAAQVLSLFWEAVNEPFINDSSLAQ